MKATDRLLYLTAIAVLGILFLSVGWQWRAAAVAAASKSQSVAVLVEAQGRLLSELAALRSEKERLRAEVSRLEADLEQARTWPFVVLSDHSIAEMKALGLVDPIADLVADLERRSELVPFEPIGGGEPRIGLWLINRNWVLAGVSDGHKGIWAMLTYEIKQGQIEWTLLAHEQ